MGTRTLIECYVNGQPKRIGYLGQLRILPQFRGRPSMLRRGYASLQQLHADGTAEFYVTTIISDNEPARRILEAGLPQLPTYRFVGDLVTLYLSTSRTPLAGPAKLRPLPGAPAGRAIVVGPARIEDLDAIVHCLNRNGARYQFAPCWTRADLLSPMRSRGLGIQDFFIARDGNRVVGCVACWDQREFKQTVVRGYSRRMACVRPLSNLLAPLTGIPRLPRVGESLACAYASHLAVDDDEPRVFEALVRAVLRLAAQRGIDHLLLGLAETNPLTSVALQIFKARQYRSRAYVVHWADGAAAARTVDSRLLHLEIAIL